MAAGRKTEGIREKAALLLAAGRTGVQAARLTGCSRRTLTNWRADPCFTARVRVLRDRLLNRTVGLLAGSSARAVRTLAKLLDDEKADIRLRAADKLLGHTLRAYEMQELTRRVEELEARAGIGDK
jgi:Homeodomain-like domain